MVPLQPELRSVLVVDDDPFQRKVLRAWLEASGWNVREASGVAEALERMEEVAVALVDLRLGDEDGFGVANGRPPSSEGPSLVAMSAEMSDGVRERCRNAGFVDTMAKPFQREAVLDTVRRLAGAEAHEGTGDSSREDATGRDPVPAGLRDVPALAALWRMEQTSTEPELMPAIEGLRQAGRLLTSAAADAGPQTSRAVAAAAHGLAGAAGILGCTRVEATSKALASKVRDRGLDGETRLLITVIEAEVEAAVEDLRRKVEEAGLSDPRTSTPGPSR